MILCGYTKVGTGERAGVGARSPPPPTPVGKRVEGGEGQSGLKRVDYVKINDKTWIRRGNCPRLEHHHLIIWTNPIERWPGKQQQKQQ